MATVVFNPDEFKGINPQFADFTDEQLLFSFNVACELVDNSESSTVPYSPPQVPTRKNLLYLLVCHLCELKIRGGHVGSMTSASEGSVSVGFAAPASSNGQWFNQTQCGATAWQLMAPYRLGGRLYAGDCC